MSKVHSLTEKVDSTETEKTKVTFLPANLSFKAEVGQSILDVALENGVPLDHACGGVCACSTCHVVVKEGMELLREMEDDEADQLDEAAGLTLSSRLGCQSVIEREGNVVVEIPSWNRNYAREGE
ncbi:MAG: 2Fe-2S iron-sulfur cluster binding domain-containing protein [Blastocatellia bacterium]|nr:2Fe-2S iron-sulfur cluster binding domain-containing protein [Blastocatellia bacterium]